LDGRPDWRASASMVTRLLWLVVTRCGFDDRIASMVLWRQQGPVKDTVHTAPGCTGSFHGSFLCPSQLHREELLMRSSPGSSLPEHVASTYGNVRGAFTCWLAKLTAARARGADPRHSRLHASDETACRAGSREQRGLRGTSHKAPFGNRRFLRRTQQNTDRPSFLYIKINLGLASTLNLKIFRN
jgi:hypothetical protein